MLNAMTDIQKSIIQAIKQDSFFVSNRGEDYKTTIQGILRRLPGKTAQEIGEGLQGMDGVTKTGNELEAQIIFPASYFN
jgi:hypothetical protein